MTLQELPTAKPAFDAVYTQYHTRIIGFLLNRLRTDRADAEDLAHDAITKMWAAWPRFEYATDDGVADWVFRIALNVLRDALRHRKLIQWQPWDVAYGPEVNVSASNLQRVIHADPLCKPEVDALSNEGVADLRRILSRLPLPQRTALSLRALHDLSYLDIGAVMGLTAPAVKSLIYRARIECRATQTRDAITAAASERRQ
ncbi:MAG TPA: sigma-70 family RNA polymerase sigma factor [Chloroflexota bacterium]|nr:sigma-70 family RNA polymerase sigma factor [Chloroflexota bacterium]